MVIRYYIAHREKNNFFDSYKPVYESYIILLTGRRITFLIVTSQFMKVIDIDSYR